MTHDPLPADKLRHALQTAGFRCTPQRLAVYEQLAAAHHHPTAEEVFQAVRKRIPRLSLATVYKALEALVEIGAASRLSASGGADSSRYDARSEAHYHFRCLQSGDVIDLPTPFDPDLISRLDPLLVHELKGRGLQVTGYRLELIGYRSPSGAEPRDRSPSSARDDVKS